jgi:hypothetical protein
MRVLPVEIAPHKSYTRPVIETACAAYAATDRPTITLRQTVARLGKNHPHPSALHGWLGGLGARALGRLDRQSVGPPVAALIAESAKVLRRELPAAWTQPYAVAPHKCRSGQRREQLEACARLFDTAGRLFPQAVYPFTAWEQWLSEEGSVLGRGVSPRI